MENWCLESLAIHGGITFCFQKRLKFIKKKSKDWKIMDFGNVQEEKGNIEKNMEQLQQIMIEEGGIEELEIRKMN